MNVSIGIITWENLHTTKILLESIFNELHIIDNIYNVKIFVCDNGSTDGTVDFISKKYPSIILIPFNDNKGEGIAKDKLVQEALKTDSKYIFIFDNDLKVIPNSLNIMIKYMENNEKVGCFGQNINFYCTDENDKKICDKMPEYKDLNISFNIKSGCGAIRAWTHYGIYRMDLFKNGIAFDVNGALGLPGYGFADDDLGMQISKAGYDIACFNDIYCFHEISSSVPRLKEKNILKYREREEYFKNKWKNSL